jgi:hypothetical protein
MWGTSICDCLQVSVFSSTHPPNIRSLQNPCRSCVSVFCAPPSHLSHIQPFRLTIAVSSYLIFSLNYTYHEIICETYLYAMYRSHKRAIASESNDPLGFSRPIFYSHNTAGVATQHTIYPWVSLVSTMTRSSTASAVFLGCLFYRHVFVNKAVNHMWVCERTVYIPLRHVKVPSNCSSSETFPVPQYSLVFIFSSTLIEFIAV